MHAGVLNLFGSQLTATYRTKFASVQKDSGALRTTVDLNNLVQRVLDRVHFDIAPRTGQGPRHDWPGNRSKRPLQCRPTTLALVVEARQLLSVEPNAMATLVTDVDEYDAEVLVNHRGTAGRTGTRIRCHGCGSNFAPVGNAQFSSSSKHAGPGRDRARLWQHATSRTIGNRRVRAPNRGSPSSVKTLLCSAVIDRCRLWFFHGRRFAHAVGTQRLPARSAQ